ncbi:hypothetical protein ASPFODRAFT_62105 [Aspergillus luchuensis CBS 106.47]|uniref:Uncharacterized protein n=1 Tax=Aspergillus luchuensis (strain CBS 106.47) TaxID=1137211 RepID=A0A1M3TFG1_ASPLC|nr:hypothetical protein ASPFODRAFT_62105 [Aspergillus luchuensis CBS 106.47]
MAVLTLEGGENEYNRAIRGNYSRLEAFRIIQECLAPEYTVTIEQTAQALHKLLPPPDDPTYPGGADLFGDLILELSQQVEYDNPAQDRYVQVIQRLQDSDRVKKYIPQPEGVGGYGRYEIMPQLMSNLGQYSAQRMDRNGNRNYFVNVRAFIARLCRVGALQGQAWLVNEMKDAFEETLPEQFHVVSIMGAAVIIEFAGGWLYEEVVRAPKLDEINDNPLWANGYYYNGPRYGIARWNHWQRLFRWAEQTMPLDRESKRLIFYAEWYMHGMSRSLQPY